MSKIAIINSILVSSEMQCAAYSKQQDHTDQVKNKPQYLLLTLPVANRRVARNFSMGENKNRVSTFEYLCLFLKHHP